MNNKTLKLIISGVALSALVGFSPATTQASESVSLATADNRISDTRFRTMSIQGIDIAYREAGDPSNPAVVLLHGFPTSRSRALWSQSPRSWAQLRTGLATLFQHVNSAAPPFSRPAWPLTLQTMITSAHRPAVGSTCLSARQA